MANNSNGWVRPWKQTGIVVATITASFLLIQQIWKIAVSIDKIARADAVHVAAEAAIARQLQVIAEGSITIDKRISRLERIMARSSRVVADGAAAQKNILRTMLKPPSPQEKKEMLSEVGVDTGKKENEQ